MKKVLISALLFLYSITSAQESVIKSLQVYSEPDQVSFPVVILNKKQEQKITIEFDASADREPNLAIEFKFCDLNWVPYSNMFLVNQGKNITPSLWLETIPVPNAGAKFHYKGSFPNFDITFPFPGKWIFIIRDPMYREKIYGQGAFYVVHNSIPLRTGTSRETLEGPARDQVELNRVMSFTTSFALPDSLFPSQVTGVEIVENRKIFSPFQIGKMNTGLRNFYINGGRDFTFNARDIRPRNGYRHLDLRDNNKYQAPASFAKFEGLDYSDFYTFRRQYLTGGSLILDYKNEYSQYIRIKFRFKPSEEPRRRVFLTGSFTNWLVLPEYEMINENGLYTAEVELKRGEYDYQYVLGDVVNGQVTNIDWWSIEGNYWETDNEYNIFVHYFTPDYGGYNKIIGYKKIRSGGL